jgi:formylglycine-generating enzyme required for sulfatase activity
MDKRPIICAALSAALAAQAAEVTNSVGMRLVPIHSGEFVMGQDGAREGAPAHRVRLTRPFALAATEVTRGQWKAVMGAEPPDLGLKDQTDQHPVVGVTWFDAVGFCKKLSAKEGTTYRLPTEAEWEYACRAGTNTAYSFGPKPDLAKMVCEADPKERHLPIIHTRSSPVVVGSTPVNAWGLHEMHGNVHEWCYDWFDGEHYVQDLLTRLFSTLSEEDRTKYANAETQGNGTAGTEREKVFQDRFAPDYPTGAEIERRKTPRLELALRIARSDPIGPARGQAGKRAIRSGGWGQPAQHCRAASRFGADPLWRNQAIGFRVLREENSSGLAANLVYPQPPGEVDIPGYGRLPEILVTPAGMRFILVKPGTFRNGMTKEEAKDLSVNLHPPRQVTFTKPYYLAATVYTRAVTAMNGAGNTALGDQALHPASYEEDRPHTQPMYDAIELMLVMSLRDGRLYRLPTVYAWEYAARAGTTTIYYFGNDLGRYFEYEFHRGQGEGDHPRHVGRKLPNPWGFFDLLSNTTQWLSTPAADMDLNPGQPLTDPVGDPIGRPRTPELTYLRRGDGYRYRIAPCGWANLGTKFGNYRNCSRIGGFRLAFDADQVSTRPVDAAWSQQILELRVANFVAGGDYGLTWVARTKTNAGVNGGEGSGTEAIEYYRRVLSIDPGNQAARAGLNRVKAELLPMWREKCTGNAPALAAIAQNERQVNELLAMKP